MRYAWMYFLDVCDHAGIVECNLRKFEFDLGFKISPEEISSYFKEKISFYGDKFLINKFAEFQYGNLDKNNRIVNSINDKIHKLKQTLTKESGNSLVRDKVQVQVQVKVPVKVKVQVPSPENPDKVSETDFNRIYMIYPRKEGKADGVRKLKSILKTVDDVDRVITAIRNYKAHLLRNKTEPKYIKLFSTFMSTWEDWLDVETGSVQMQVFQ